MINYTRNEKKRNRTQKMGRKLDFNNQSKKFKEMKELKISVENARAAYDNTNANGRELLEHLLGKEVFAQDIKDRVKTFTDALRVLRTPEELISDDFFKEQEKLGEDVVAMLKLRVIAEALNEGWRPKFDGDECRFYPWFYIYTKKEYEELDEDKKKECRVVGQSNINANANGGVVFAFADVASSFSITDSGSRLAFKTRELAEYCVKQFIEIWEKWLFA